MVARSMVGSRWLGPWAAVLALVAVLPLVAAEVWSGFRVGLTDPVLSVLAPSEQPLSTNSPAGVWAMALTATWFGLAYRHRHVRLWEAGLVLCGGAVALARAGNTWLCALLLIGPLIRQLAHSDLRVWQQLAVGVLGLAMTGATLLGARPPELSAAATRAALLSPTRGAVLADWRWAAALQRGLPPDRQILATGGLSSESIDFWTDYLRIAQGHEHWALLLQQLNVGLVVLDAADQQRKVASLVRSSAEWQVLYDDRGTLVAQRSGP